jgi:hypothetical protein
MANVTQLDIRHDTDNNDEDGARPQIGLIDLNLSVPMVMTSSAMAGASAQPTTIVSVKILPVEDVKSEYPK